MKTRRIFMSLAGVMLGAVSVGIFKIAAFFMGPLIELFNRTVARPMLKNRDNPTYPVDFLTKRGKKRIIGLYDCRKKEDFL